MREFCVYMHLRKDDGVPLYIGKGLKKRAYSKHGRSGFWKSMVNFHGGFDVSIIAENLTEDEAFTHERRFIKFYGRIDLCNGPLVNFTNGGEGLKGAGFGNQNWRYRVETEETRRKKSESHKGIKRPEHSRMMTGRKVPNKTQTGFPQSEATKQKLREANLGKKASPEARAKMTASQLKRWAEIKKAKCAAT